MLTLSQIQQDPDKVIQQLQQRGVCHAETLVHRLLNIVQTKKQQQDQLEKINHQLKEHAKTIAQWMKIKTAAQKIDSLKKEISCLKKQQQKEKQQIQGYAQGIQDILVQLPNVFCTTVPIGKYSQDNTIVHERFFIHSLPKVVVPHWDIAQKYDLIDFSIGTKITGTGFPVYKNEGAQLQRALIQFFLTEAIKNGYQEIMLPLLVNHATAFNTGQLPDKEGQMYKIQDHPFYLIPTAEVPLTNLYQKRILSEKDLPIKHVAYTPCFRREAGSWGSNVRGLNRLHQFDKVEIVEIHTPQQSFQAFKKMIAYVQQLLEKLQLTYRKVLLCSGDLGFTAYCTYDFEVYAPGQKKWLEVSSVSHFDTYQAHRLQLKYEEDEQQRKHWVHTLNGSALALPRVMASLLETYQTAQGIQIPSVLLPYAYHLRESTVFRV